MILKELRWGRFLLISSGKLVHVPCLAFVMGVLGSYWTDLEMQQNVWCIT